ncbi:MAG: hypothetical protein HQL55_08870 [Magnetococcales bacterium]|nr:hypothetical protein [Magnetococcales bacterium]
MLAALQKILDWPLTNGTMGHILWQLGRWRASKNPGGLLALWQKKGG